MHGASKGFQNYKESACQDVNHLDEDAVCTSARHRPGMDPVLLPRSPVPVVPVLIEPLGHAAVRCGNTRLHLCFKLVCQQPSQHRLCELILLQ